MFILHLSPKVVIPAWVVIPAKAGIQVVVLLFDIMFETWIPAFAGMTASAGMTAHAEMTASAGMTAS